MGQADGCFQFPFSYKVITAANEAVESMVNILASGRMYVPQECSVVMCGMVDSIGELSPI